MSTPEEIEVARRNLVAELKQMLRRKDLDEYPIDARTARDLVEVLEALAPRTSVDPVDEAALYIARSARPDQSEADIQQWYQVIIHDADALIRAFQIAATRMHPDRGGSWVDFRRLQHAKTTIDRSRR